MEKAKPYAIYKKGLLHNKLNRLEWENIEVYKFHNLPVRNKILFYGTTS